MSLSGDSGWMDVEEEDELSVLETLDHVLSKGMVVAGDVTIAVADVDLVFVGVNLLLGSVETIERVLGEKGEPGGRGRNIDV